MKQKYIDGYIYTRKHDFEVDTHKSKKKDRIHFYVWVDVDVPPEFTFITSGHIERGMIDPTSKITIDNDGEMHLKHGHSKWFRPTKDQSNICEAISQAYKEWSVEEILIGGSYEN